MKESEIQRDCLQLLAAKGILAMRINNTGIYDPSRKCFRSFHGTKGVPDIICILPEMTPEGIVGAFVGIECKTPTGKLSDAQRALHGQIVASGGTVLTVRSVDELQADLAELGF